MTRLVLNLHTAYSDVGGTMYKQTKAYFLEAKRWQCFIFFTYHNVWCFSTCARFAYLTAKIRFMYSQNWNCEASFPVPTFMYLWVTYIIPRIGLPILLLVHECRNWKRGRAVSFLGIFVSIFPHRFFAVVLNRMGHFQEKDKLIKAIIAWLLTHQLKEGGGWYWGGLVILYCTRR